MRKRIILMLTVILSAALLAGGCNTENKTANEGINIGNRALDFELKTLEGESVNLNDYRDKNPVLLNFWATWCPPCRYEMPFLQQINDDYSPKGLVMLAVDIGENPTIITNYMTSLNLSLPVLLDSNSAVARNYGITGIPTTILIDKDGIIRYKKIGAFLSKSEIETAIKTVMP